MDKKTIIIGGVAGGATTAARLRRRNQNMEIIMLERGEYISYANCGLPYYIGGVIKERENLLLQTPAAMKQKFNIDVRIQSEVIKILPQEKKVVIKKLPGGETYQESYDNLVIATGSTPVRPPIKGIEAENIFTLWNVPDTDRIKTYLEKKRPKSAVVIGGGFIGLEMAENLAGVGLQVSLVEMQNQVMTPLDFEMAELLHENMHQNGVELILLDGVTSFEQHQSKTNIQLSSGRQINADLVILAIGIKPNSGLAKDAGLQLNEKGGIVVDAYMKTSNQSIYAVGDVVETIQFATKEKTMLPLAGPANRQGRICADNIAGDQKKYKGSLGTSVAKVFDLAAATVGINEKALKAQGKVKDIDYETLLIRQKSHAGYYPGARMLTLKLLFEKDGKLLGAQAVGGAGVDKRIDTIAAVMGLNGTVHDLTELEPSYAPPFSSAKDPVNMAGFVAENILDGLVSFIEYNQLDEILHSNNDDAVILDVTEEVERMVFCLPGSCHIPLGQLRNRMTELDRNKLIIVYCAIGVRSYNAARILSGNGFQKVKVLSGGTSFYKSMHWRSMGIIAKEAVQLEAAACKEEQMTQVLDCSGLQCPGPIMKVSQALEGMEKGDTLQVSATDMGFAADISAWCKRTGNTLVQTKRKEKENIVLIKKGADQPVLQAGTAPTLPQGKTIIVFSGDLDKVLASFIIANGAAAMGRPVTMFFTFWGLNALRKPKKQKVKKPFLDRMFGAMMPRGVKKLKLSKMNMGGMGTQMMKKVMKDKNVNSLEELMKSAMEQGIKLVACTMSMDVMGITRQELIDGIEYAGVAAYLGDAEESNVNLFV